MKKLRIKSDEQTVRISTEFIKLDSFLKLCNAVTSGGEAKVQIQNEYVKVNGQICTQRGKKLVNGDVITYMNINYKVVN